MNTTTKFISKFLIGEKDGEKIYLSAPSWDCGWYWGFGYLGNGNCHYHVDGLMKDCNLFDGLKKEFGNTLKLRESDIWTFCELMKTFYVLRETAEVLGRGGAHYTTNPCESLITNKKEVTRINEKVLPAIFDAIHEILERNTDNDAIYKKINKLYLKGDTQKILEYMESVKMNPDDIKEHITALDFDTIHSAYYQKLHSKK